MRGGTNERAVKLHRKSATLGNAFAIEHVQAIMRDDPTQALSKPKAKKPKPNQPCSCGSGRKYKKCCGALG